MKNVLAAILLGSLLASGNARAEVSGIVGADEKLNDAVAGVSLVTRNAAASAEVVKDLGDRAFGQPNAVKVSVHADLRGWDFLPKAPGGDLSFENVSADARRRLSDKGASLSSALDGALATGELLESNGRAHFAAKGQMSPYEAGVFFYKDDSTDLGRILLNYNMKEMLEDADKESNSEMRDAARLAAWIAAEATYIHESAHALAKAWNALHPNHVIDGEVFAFSLEREFLLKIDPHKEGVATLIMVAQLHNKAHPSRTAKLCYELSSMLGNLQRTDGKPETIEAKIVIPAGYTENKSVL